jgi:NAD-dependent deacetylase
MDSTLTRIAEKIYQVDSVVAFTGAGISTESGIPDFRSPGGVWTKYRTVYYDEIISDRDARIYYWKMKYEGHRDFADAQPNAAHNGLAELERLGKLQALITQNIDGLHQDAGNSSERVIELHGTNRFVNCLECEARYTAEEIMTRIGNGEEDPPCAACGGIMKPATVAFGQPMPAAEIEAASRAAQGADVFLAIGSSLVVQPACQMPEIAKMNGAFLMILNLEPTPLDNLADIVLHEKAGAVIENIVTIIKQKMNT